MRATSRGIARIGRVGPSSAGVRPRPCLRCGSPFPTTAAVRICRRCTLLNAEVDDTLTYRAMSGARGLRW